MSLIYSVTILSFVRLKLPISYIQIIYTKTSYSIRLDLFPLMMALEKKLLLKYQLAWRPIRHSIQILMAVILLKG